MSNTVRLFIARNAQNENVINAQNADADEQITVAPEQNYNFFVDLIGMTQAVADRYNDGETVATGMSLKNWQTWVADANLPELSDPHHLVRLLCFQLPGTSSIYAIDLTTKVEVVVTSEDVENFIADCGPWDAARLSAGHGIKTHMSKSLWPSWTRDDEFGYLSQTNYVPVTASAEAMDCILAICLTDKREVAVPSDEAANFLNDCHGCDFDQFANEQSSVGLVSREDWAAWLEHFETAPLSDETAAALCG